MKAIPRTVFSAVPGRNGKSVLQGQSRSCPLFPRVLQPTGQDIFMKWAGGTRLGGTVRAGLELEPGEHLEEV